MTSLYGSSCKAAVGSVRIVETVGHHRTHLERDKRDALLLVADEEEVLERRQARDVHADVEEADSEEELVLLERTGVQLLAHREEEVAVQVADVVDSRLGVFEEEEAELVVEVRRRGMRVDLNDLEDVDLRAGQVQRGSR